MADENQTPDTNDYQMSFEDSADRVPVLWIHGFPLNNTLWDYQVDGLADVARLITPDLRGHGMSEATEPPYSMATFADDCVNLLDDIGCAGPVVVAGLSMGGYVAFEICRRHPERVAGLILAATRAGADSAETKAVRDASAGVAIAEGVEPIAEGMLPKLMAPDTYEKEPDLVEFVREMMLETSVDGLVGASAAMRDRPDSVPDLAGLELPTLILHGAEDQLIPVSEAEVMRDGIPGAELVVLEGAGHLPNMEKPEEFNAAVRGFFEGFYS